MNLAQSATLHRIDRDRRTLASTCRGRILAAAKRGDELAEAIERQAMLAYVTGMYRTVLDASKATKRDVRTAHFDLSRAEDEKKDRDRLLWLLAFLGLPWTTVEMIRYQSGRVAENAGRELRRAAQNAAIRTQTRVEATNAERSGNAQSGRGVGAGRSGGNAVEVSRLSERLRQDSPFDSVRGRTGGHQGNGVDVFGRFGLADIKLPEAAVETWAEAVAYSQYERGRMGAVNQFPAVSEALWGYRYMAVLDNRTSKTCRTLDRMTLRLGNPLIEALWPPVHFHCRSMWVPVWQASGLKKPVEHDVPPAATLSRYIAMREDFMRRVA